MRGFFGHPKGLATLFLTEMWERFSYYGMRAILLYYMYDQLSHGGLGMSKPTAAALVSVYGSLVYMSGIIGGWLADRLLGMRRGVFVGGVLIMCGHLALSVPAGVGALYVSMVLIVVGTGLLKPNASSLVGTLYGRTDLRRDAGFSIFYMGINLGAFLAPYVVGTLGQRVDYHLGFAAAAVGMALGLTLYLIGGRRHLPADAGRVPNPLRPEERTQIAVRAGIGAAAVALLLVLLGIGGALTVTGVTTAISVLAVLLPIGYFTLMLRSPRTTGEERSRLVAYVPLFVASVFFWVVDEQGGTVLAQFADSRTDLDALGFTIPSSWFQSVNPVSTLILAPTFAALWVRLGRRQPSTARKFALGLVLAALSYLIMAVPGALYGTGTPVGPLWLVASLVIVVAGAMCLSPVGLSATTRLAPAAFAAQMMSLWFLSDAAAQGINAQLVRLYRPDTEVAYFAVTGLVLLVVAVAVYLMAPWIRTRMRGAEPTDAVPETVTVQGE
ncbi:MAG TPA: peptide MFS transporter [Actinocatenispora sp.]